MGFIKDTIEKSAEFAAGVTFVIVEGAITGTAVMISEISEGLQDLFDD